MLILFIIFLNIFSQQTFAPSVARDVRPSLSRPLKLAWSYDSAETLALSPVNYEDQLYVPLNGGRIAALQISNGDLNWKTEVGGLISAVPDADRKGVYVATEVSMETRSGQRKSRGLLRLLSRDNGVVGWVCETEAPIRGSITVSDGLLFAASIEGRLYALESGTGVVKWVRQNGARFYSQPFVNGKTLFIGDEEGNLFAIHRDTGEVVWRYQTRLPLRVQTAQHAETIFTGTAEQHIQALNAGDGRPLWRAKLSGSVQGIATGGGRLVVTTLDNFVYGFSAESGKRLWKRRLAGRVTAKPLVTSDGILLAPLAGDEAIVLNPENGRKINSIEVGEDNNTNATPAVSGDMVLLSTRRGIFAYVNAQALNDLTPLPPQRSVAARP